jgi:hypothetical protein
MDDRIVDKLNGLLKELPFTKECQIVYLFVETRKLLDRTGQSDKYAFIRFFCDWVLHTEKTQNLKIVRDDFEKIAIDIEAQGKKSIVQLIVGSDTRSIEQFVDFVKLRAQLGNLFQKNKIVNSLIVDDDNWFSMRNLLFRVLADQPIDFKDKPVRDIKSMHFSEIRKELYGCLLCIGYMKDGLIKERHYVFADNHPNFKISKQ